jgi:Tol biopolymer transport system component/DNA-binding winged helix-turn-helix (wHTH) protein
MLLETQKLAFGDFLLDLEEKILFCNNELIPITPKLYDLLYFLVKNHGHIVEKDAVMNEVWADSFVEESNLTYTIRQLRKILGDNARNPKYIETVPRRGYRFIAKVSEINGHLNNAVISGKSESDRIAANKSFDNSISKSYRIQRNLLLAVTIILMVAGIFLINSQVTKRENLSKNLTFKSLKTNGKLIHTAISPDGRFFVFTNETDKKISLWLQNIETSEKRQILPAADVFYFGLTFSNDGNSIYFVRRKQVGTNNADVFRISTFGNIPEKIIETAEGWISLSPDDKKISFVRSEKDANYSLFIADSDGKNEVKLLTRESPERIGANKISPDGNSIVFAAGQSSDGTKDFRIFRFDLENKTEVLFSKQNFFVINELSWMPDGKDILIAAGSEYGKPHKIWRVSGEAGKAEILTAEATNYKSLSLDKSGKKLLAMQVKNSFELSIFPISDANTKKILASAGNARFISDSEIVYSANEGDLWKINTNGEGQQQLTTSDFVNHYPLISPDGKSIYFVSSRNGSNQIWRMNSDGSNQIQMTEKIGGFPIHVSSDGKKLLFESTLYKTIWQVSTDGTDKEKEVWDRKLLFSAISADEKKIAFLRHDESKERQLDIEIYDFEDKTLIQKIYLAEKDLKPVKLAWLNDSETLLYITRNKSGYKLWKQKIGFEPPQMIGDLGKNRIRDFSVSPNGDNILIISGEWLQDVILIEGFN